MVNPFTVNVLGGYDVGAGIQNLGNVLAQAKQASQQQQQQQQLEQLRVAAAKGDPQALQQLAGYDYATYEKILTAQQQQEEKQAKDLAFGYMQLDTPEDKLAYLERARKTGVDEDDIATLERLNDAKDGRALALRLFDSDIADTYYPLAKDPDKLSIEEALKYATFESAMKYNETGNIADLVAKDGSEMYTPADLQDIASNESIIQYLRTGNKQFLQAAGPDQEVVDYTDFKDIATPASLLKAMQADDLSLLQPQVENDDLIPFKDLINVATPESINEYYETGNMGVLDYSVAGAKKYPITPDSLVGKVTPDSLKKYASSANANDLVFNSTGTEYPIAPKDVVDLVTPASFKEYSKTKNVDDLAFVTDATVDYPVPLKDLLGMVTEDSFKRYAATADINDVVFTNSDIEYPVPPKDVLGKVSEESFKQYSKTANVDDLVFTNEFTKPKPLTINTDTGVAFVDPNTMGFISEVEVPTMVAARNREIDKQKSAAELEARDRLFEGRSLMYNARNAIRVANEIENHPGFKGVVGFRLGDEDLFGTAAAGAKALIEQLQSQMFLSEIQKMRGLGQLSNLEGSRVEKVIAALNPNSNEVDIKKALGEVRKYFKFVTSQLTLKYGDDVDAGMDTLFPSNVPPPLKTNTTELDSALDRYRD